MKTILDNFCSTNKLNSSEFILLNNNLLFYFSEILRNKYITLLYGTAIVTGNLTYLTDMETLWLGFLQSNHIGKCHSKCNLTLHCGLFNLLQKCSVCGLY